MLAGRQESVTTVGRPMKQNLCGGSQSISMGSGRTPNKSIVRGGTPNESIVCSWMPRAVGNTKERR